MIDAREAIITRLVEIAQTIEGVKFIDRNISALDDDADVFPAIVIMDGDEDADPGDPRRTRKETPEPRRIHMTPSLLVATGAKPEETGTDLNTLRNRVIKAVLTDETLLGLTLNDRSIRYDGMTTPRTETGRLFLSQRYLRFTLTYVMRPDQL